MQAVKLGTTSFRRDFCYISAGRFCRHKQCSANGSNYLRTLNHHPFAGNPWPVTFLLQSG